MFFYFLFFDFYKKAYVPPETDEKKMIEIDETKTNGKVNLINHNGKSNDQNGIEKLTNEKISNGKVKRS